jgi:cell division protein ZapA
VQIKILNQTFNIQGVDDEEYLRKLATHVEERMTELQRATNTIDSNRLALLAALHIADDYFQLQNQMQQLDRFVSRKSAEFVKILDQFTQEPPS